MKIKLFSILFLVLPIFYVNADNLTVKTNINGGEYNNTLEINIIASDKNAKIFYYTDDEGRLDNQIQFKKENPIIIKKDSTLSYYAMLDFQNSTLIKEEKYTFKYPSNFELLYKSGVIQLINKENKTINIGYWKIESDNLNYEIYKNTFLDKYGTYKINYKAKEGEKIKLISPDKKIKIEYSIPFTKIKEEIINKKDNNKELSFEIKKEIENIEDTPIEQINTFPNNKTDKVNNDDFNYSKHLKTSITETDDKNFWVIIIIFIGLGILVRIYLLLDKFGIKDKIVSKIKSIRFF